jgi:hypothetical protein
LGTLLTTALLLVSLNVDPAAEATSPSAVSNPTAKITKVAVSELEAGFGADPKLVHTLTALLTAELRKRSTLAITSQEDIKTLLGLQRQKQLLNCAEKSCLTEIGGALGVDQMVTGSLSQVGESYLLDLRAIDVKKAVALHEASRRLHTTDPEAWLDAVAELSGELYPAPASAVRQPVPEVALSTPEPPKRRSLLGPIAVGAAGAAAALIGGLVWLDAAKAGGKQTVGGDNIYALTYAEAQSRNSEAAVGGVLFFSGIVVGICGLGWGLFR